MDENNSDLAALDAMFPDQRFRGRGRYKRKHKLVCPYGHPKTLGVRNGKPRYRCTTCENKHRRAYNDKYARDYLMGRIAKTRAKLERLEKELAAYDAGRQSQASSEEGTQ